MLKNHPDIAMRDNNQFLRLEPIECEGILPLVTLHSLDEWVHFRIYVLLTTFDEYSNFKTLAFRFETDEGDYDSEDEAGTHDFCHMQFCQSINNKVRDIAPLWLPVSQPSIPLDANCQISLVLCMLVSLYGGKEVKKRLSEPGYRSLKKHLLEVRALKQPGKNRKK